jgi:hypothetical protein
MRRRREELTQTFSSSPALRFAMKTCAPLCQQSGQRTQPIFGISDLGMGVDVALFRRFALKDRDGYRWLTVQDQ